MSQLGIGGLWLPGPAGIRVVVAVLAGWCGGAVLIVELDGGQHSEDEQMHRDEIRTLWLASRGYRVLRIWNSDLYKA